MIGSEVVVAAFRLSKTIVEASDRIRILQCNGQIVPRFVLKGLLYLRNWTWYDRSSLTCILAWSTGLVLVSLTMGQEHLACCQINEEDGEKREAFISSIFRWSV